MLEEEPGEQGVGAERGEGGWREGESFGERGGGGEVATGRGEGVGETMGRGEGGGG